VLRPGLRSDEKSDVTHLLYGIVRGTGTDGRSIARRAGASRTQVWLATSDDPGPQVKSQCFYHMRPLAPNLAAQDKDLQDQLLEAATLLSGVSLPAYCRMRRFPGLAMVCSLPKKSPTTLNLRPSFPHQHTALMAPVSSRFHSCPGVHLTCPGVWLAPGIFFVAGLREPQCNFYVLCGRCRRKQVLRFVSGESITDECWEFGASRRTEDGWLP
jgi:hypothetical protein